MSTLAEAPVIVRVDFLMLQAIMGRAVERSRRPQECLGWEPERVVWADDRQSATFQYPDVTYLISYRAGGRGAMVFEHRGDLCFVWSRQGEVIRAEQTGSRHDPFLEAMRRPSTTRPELN